MCPQRQLRLATPPYYASNSPDLSHQQAAQPDAADVTRKARRAQHKHGTPAAAGYTALSMTVMATLLGAVPQRHSLLSS